MKARLFWPIPLMNGTELAGVTVAVKVTDWPTVVGLVNEVSAVVVASGLTVRVVEPLLEAWRSRRRR